MSYAVLLLFYMSVVSVLGDFNLLILHNNDMHGRFEETERNSATCRENHRNVSCIGGFARTAYELRRYRKLAEEGKGPEVLYLNGGDTYVGTVWYSLFTWNISAEFVNLLEPDAISLGNHEFDLTVGGLVPFVKAVTCPIVAANLDFTHEPYLNKIKKSVVIEKGGQKIGVIGYLTPDTKKISSPGKIIFHDEVSSIRAESERLDKEGVKVIIALGHSGFQIDKKIAAEVPLIDVVVGGHTNTFLWNGPQPDKEKVEGPYPWVVTQRSGKKVPVVQAYAFTKYLGRLNTTFNDEGDLTHFSGQPVLLDSSIPQDKEVLEALEKYRPTVVEINKEIVGKTNVLLDGDSAKCRTGECNFGNLIADSMVYYKASVSPQTWTEAPIGLFNGGGVRTTIDSASGDITRGDILAALPFGNTIVTMTLNGSDLIKTLEIGIRSDGETSMGEFLQVSGLRVLYDRSKPAHSRVVSVKARCGVCRVPMYESIELNRNYTIVTTSFLSDGGDAHSILAERGLNKVTEDLGDVDVMVWYLEKHSPVTPEVEGRIKFVDECRSSADSPKFNVITIFTITLLIITLKAY